MSCSRTPSSRRCYTPSATPGEVDAETGTGEGGGSARRLRGVWRCFLFLFGLLWSALDWSGLGWVGLGWVGLGWVGLGWVGLG